jgi:hypothetical protein
LGVSWRKIALGTHLKQVEPLLSEHGVEGRLLDTISRKLQLRRWLEAPRAWVVQELKAYIGMGMGSLHEVSETGGGQIREEGRETSEKAGPA